MNYTRVFAIVLRHMYNWRKDIDRMVDAVWWATIDIIFWGLTSSYIRQAFLPTSFDIVTLFVGGIIFWTIIQNSQREINMPLLDEAWNRNLINIFTTPLQLREFITATIILGILKLTITLCFLSFLAFVLYHFNIFLYGWYLLPSIANLLLVGWWMGFIIDGLIFRFGYKIQAFAWAFVFVIYPFSAVLYPVSVLPEWGQIISKFLPTSYVFENMRSILFFGQFSFAFIGISLILNIIYLTLSLIFLRASFAKARDKGRLVKLN